jgi:hypothetical protein
MTLPAMLPDTTQHRIAALDHGKRTETLGVVIHVMEGTLLGTLSWWADARDKGIGAQVCIGANGQSVQTADLNSVCYHAPGDDSARIGAQSGNHEYVGIEHEGTAEQSKLTWIRRRRQRKASANRAAFILYYGRCGKPKWGFNVVPHRDFPEGGHPNCPGPNFPTLLYMRAVKRAYRNLENSGGQYWTNRK